MRRCANFNIGLWANSKNVQLNLAKIGKSVHNVIPGICGVVRVTLPPYQKKNDGMRARGWKNGAVRVKSKIV